MIVLSHVISCHDAISISTVQQLSSVYYIDADVVLAHHVSCIIHHASRTLFQGDRLASRLRMSYGAMESLIAPSNPTFPQLCVNPPILSVFRPSPLLVGLEWRPASPPLIYFMSRMCRFELTVDFVFFPALLVDDRVVPGVSVSVQRHMR